MRILFITSTRIGDAVLSTGLLAHLVEVYPAALVSVAAGPEALPLFAALPQLERGIAMTKGRWARHWTRLWTECIGTRWDLVVDLRGSAIAFLLCTHRRLRLKRSTEVVHRVREIADVLDLPEAPMPIVWTAASHRARAASLIPDGGPVIGVGPVTNWRAKTWRDTNFVSLLSYLTSENGILPGARIAIFGGPAERAEAMAVIEALPTERRIDLVGTLDLVTTYACLSRCAFYVGNDSALMHLAAAAGVPTLGLFGPSRERLYAPWGWRTATVRTLLPFERVFPEGFNHLTSDTLMDGLTVEAAVAAVAAMYYQEREDARGRRPLALPET